MTRWTLVTLALAGALAGCATSRGGAGDVDALTLPNRPGAPTVLTLMPRSAVARKTLEGLVDETGEELNFQVRYVEKSTTPAEVKRWMRGARPKAVVLMNNPSVRVYRRYLEQAPPEARQIPAIGVLTSFLRESARGMNNVTGVIYEVPILTSVVNLRDLVDQPVRRIGVLHRPIFGRFIEEQARLAAPEGIEIVRRELDEVDNASVRNGLKQLREEDGVDALWVLNDNRLLTKRLVRDAWLPSLRDNETPVIVNVRSLLSSQVDFGTFAVLPDHFALGVQAGQVLTTIADGDWRVPSAGAFEYPVAVRKVLQVRFARAHLALIEAKLASVDEIVD